MANYGIRPVRWCSAALLALIGTLGCGSEGDPGVGSDEGETAGVMLELTSSPADALCHKATFTSGGTSFERTFDVTVGTTTPVALGGLPSGAYTLTVNAFAMTCATLAAGATATWASPPVAMTLSPGVITGVTIALRKAPSTAAVLDYDTGAIVYTAPGPIRGLAVSGSTLYVADTSQIVRLPEAGGGATTVVTASTILTVGADANNLVWSTSTPNAMFRVPAMGFAVPKTLLNTGASMMTVVAGGQAVTLDAGVVRVVPFNLPTPGTATNVLMVQQHLVTGDATWGFFSNGPQLARQARTWTGGPAPIAMTTGASGEDVLGMASDGTTLFYATPEALRKIPVTGTTPTQMLSFFKTPIALVVVDSSVYFLTSALSTSPPLCVGATLSRIAKNGTTATPIWSRAGLCPNRLVQSATGLFLADTAANWVIRVPK